MSRRQHPLSVRTIDLDHEQLMILEGRPGRRLKALYGGMWLTTAGDHEDRLPSSGDEVAVMAHRQSLPQAIGKTRVELIEPIRPHALRRAFEALRRWLRPAIDPQRG
jgi:hypothetical protein